MNEKEVKRLIRVMGSSPRGKLILDFQHVNNILKFLVMLLEESPGVNPDHLSKSLETFYDLLLTYVMKDTRHHLNEFLASGDQESQEWEDKHDIDTSGMDARLKETVDDPEFRRQMRTQ